MPTTKDFSIVIIACHAGPRRALPRPAQPSRASPCLPRRASPSYADPCRAPPCLPCLARSCPAAPCLACRTIPATLGRAEPRHGGHSLACLAQIERAEPNPAVPCPARPRPAGPSCTEPRLPCQPINQILASSLIIASRRSSATLTSSQMSRSCWYRLVNALRSARA